MSAKINNEENYWHKAYNDVSRSRKLDVYGKAIINVLASYGKNCFPSINTIAKQTPCSKNKVIKTIQKLNDLGIITILKNKSNSGDWDNNSYILNYESLLDYCNKADKAVGYSDEVVTEKDYGSPSDKLPSFIEETTVVTERDSIKNNYKRTIIKNNDKYNGEDKPSPVYNTKINSKNITKEIISYLNNKAGKRYHTSAKETIKLINERLAEGYTLEDFKYVIDVKVDDWKGTDYEKYLRPITLFSDKFDDYRNQPFKYEVRGNSQYETFERRRRAEQEKIEANRKDDGEEVIF